MKVIRAIRGTLGVQELRKLTQDRDRDVVAEAYLELIERSEVVREQDVDQSFEEKPSEKLERPLIGIGSLLSSPMFLYQRKRDKVLRLVYAQQSREELESQIEWQADKSPLRYEALSNQFFDEFKDTLRADIAKRFERIEDRKLVLLRTLFGAEAGKYLSDLEENDDWIRGKFLKAGFSALAKHSEPSDLELARTFILDPHQSPSTDDILESALNIIDKHGTATDVSAVQTLLSSERSALKEQAANLMLKLDPDRRQQHMVDLLERDDDTLTKLVLRYALNETEDMPEAAILRLLYHHEESMRMMGLAYLTQKRTEEDLETLLQSYTRSDDYDYYYYDVICWLDRLVYAHETIRSYYRGELVMWLEE